MWFLKLVLWNSSKRCKFRFFEINVGTLLEMQWYIFSEFWNPWILKIHILTNQKMATIALLKWFNIGEWIFVSRIFLTVVPRKTINYFSRYCQRIYFELQCCAFFVFSNFDKLKIPMHFNFLFLGTYIIKKLVWPLFWPFLKRHYWVQIWC